MRKDTPRDRPDAETEIEVTDEMIRAGADAFAGYHDMYASLEEYLPDVFRAMLSASHHKV